jgi:hypothetical protein
MPLERPTPHDKDPLARLEAGVARLTPVVHRTVWENSNRLGLLWVHAATGVVAGTLILTTGTAMSLTLVLPHARPLTGVPAIAGGLILAAGLLARPRRVLVEVAGLVLLGAWDLVMAVGFVLSAANPAIPARWYPIAVYAGFFALISVHLWTLRSIWRGNRGPG